FYGDIANGTDPYKGGRETSVRQLIHRVTRTITDCGIADSYFADAEAAETFYDELTWLCLNQHGAFNSPVWFNVGLYHQYGVGKGAGAGNYFYNRETGEEEHAQRLAPGHRRIHRRETEGREKSLGADRTGLQRQLQRRRLWLSDVSE